MSLEILLGLWEINGLLGPLVKFANFKPIKEIWPKTIKIIKFSYKNSKYWITQKIFKKSYMQEKDS